MKPVTKYINYMNQQQVIYIDHGEYQVAQYDDDYRCWVNSKTDTIDLPLWLIIA
jgi:hypothetical protein